MTVQCFSAFVTVAAVPFHLLLILSKFPQGDAWLVAPLRKLRGQIEAGKEQKDAFTF